MIVNKKNKYEKYIAQQIGARIKKVRKEKGLKQTDFAKAKICTQADLSYFENGSLRPIDTTLARIADFMQCDYFYLRYGDEKSDNYIINKEGDIHHYEFDIFNRSLTYEDKVILEEEFTNEEKVVLATVAKALIQDREAKKDFEAYAKAKIKAIETQPLKK